VQPDELSQTSNPLPAADPPAQSRARALVWAVVLVVLVVATSLAVASSVSAWLVPPYLAVMAWLLLPYGNRRDPAHALPEGAKSPGTSGEEDVAFGEEARGDDGVEFAPAEPPEDPTATPESAALKTKHGRGRGRKPKVVVSAPSTASTWVRVGPGKFVRIEGPSAPVAEFSPTSEVEPAFVPAPSVREAGEERPEGLPPEDATEAVTAAEAPSGVSPPDFSAAAAPAAGEHEEAMNLEGTVEAAPAIEELAEVIPPGFAFAPVTEVCPEVVPPECITPAAPAVEAVLATTEDEGAREEVGPFGVPLEDAPPPACEEAPPPTAPGSEAAADAPDDAIGGSHLDAHPETDDPFAEPGIIPDEDDQGGAGDGVADAEAEDYSAVDWTEAPEVWDDPDEISREDGPEPVYGNAPEAGFAPDAFELEQADEPEAAPPESAGEVSTTSDLPAPAAAETPWISLRGAWPYPHPDGSETLAGPGAAPLGRWVRPGPRPRGTLGFRRRSRRVARRQRACRAFPPRPPPIAEVLCSAGHVWSLTRLASLPGPVADGNLARAP
jgi:hypothetical protein